MTFPRLARTGLVLLALMLPPSALTAQSGRGDLRGYVLLAGADSDTLRVTVEILRLGEPQERHRVISDSGDIYHRYEFTRVRMGEYRVTIAAPGYRSYATTLLIGSDFQGTLAVCLRRPGSEPVRRGPSGCP